MRQHRRGRTLRSRYGRADAPELHPWDIYVAKGPKEGRHRLELPFSRGTSGTAVGYHASKILRVPERLILALPAPREGRGG